MTGSVGVVVPAHDEEELLPGALAALREAAAVAEAGRPGLRVRIVVAADACCDGTAALARQAGVTVVKVSARNVGVARAAGLREVLRQQAGPRQVLRRAPEPAPAGPDAGCGGRRSLPRPGRTRARGWPRPTRTRWCRPTGCPGS